MRDVNIATAVPFYREIAHEKNLFRSAWERKIPLLLKGPTGCGKSRFVEAMAFEMGMPIIKVACNEDTSASDLIGRFLLKGNETVWQDGPVTRALRTGSLLYLDEIAEAREDVIVVIHSLTDYRRELYIDRLNEVLSAPAAFMLIASFNPGYQSRLREMKPSTRQRFVTLEFDYPSEELEQDIIQTESQCDAGMAKKLAQLGRKIRALRDLNLRESVSTRLLINAALLIRSGVNPRLACDVAIANVLSDEGDSVSALKDVISLLL